MSNQSKEYLDLNKTLGEALEIFRKYASITGQIKGKIDKIKDQDEKNLACTKVMRLAELVETIIEAQEI